MTPGEKEPDVPGPLISIREKHGGQVRELVLGGGKGNIVTEALAGELHAAVRDATTDTAASRHLKLLILTGEGGHFSYGASVEEHLPGAADRMLPAFHALIGDLLRCDVPTMAAIRGLCLGGGLEVALACSMLWCEEGAKLGVPEITLGVFPPVASVLLPLKTADAVALDMILTGRTITAPEALKAGIANNVVPAGTLDAALDDFVSTSILPKSASSLRFATSAARVRLRRRYAEDIAALESLYLGKLMSTHDAVEGIRAFLAKRPPDWRDE
jgi:cyclohexa-1,5-dienecarbonyl-CoA hydratase